jgi:hypothetical protein
LFFEPRGRPRFLGALLASDESLALLLARVETFSVFLVCPLPLPLPLTGELSLVAAARAISRGSGGGGGMSEPREQGKGCWLAGVGVFAWRWVSDAGRISSWLEILGSDGMRGTSSYTVSIDLLYCRYKTEFLLLLLPVSSASSCGSIEISSEKSHKRKPKPVVMRTNLCIQ